MTQDVEAVLDQLQRRAEEAEAQLAAKDAEIERLTLDLFNQRAVVELEHLKELAAKDAEIETLRQMRETAQELGYDDVLDALEALAARDKAIAEAVKRADDRRPFTDALVAQYIIKPLRPFTNQPATPASDDFQSGVAAWMLACFGEQISADQLERADRFTEEALELAQTMPGFTADRAHALVDYVFGRPVGERHQEVGGVMVTLAALCNTVDLNIETEARRELARIWTKVEAIRAKQATKPTGSALPIAITSITETQSESLHNALVASADEFVPPILMDEAATSASEGRDYVIRKGGYFYRPNAQWYTPAIEQAGRYTLEEAVKHSHPNGPDGPRDGITYHHVSAFSAPASEGKGK